MSDAFLVIAEKGDGRNLHEGVLQKRQLPHTQIGGQVDGISLAKLLAQLNPGRLPDYEAARKEMEFLSEEDKYGDEPWKALEDPEYGCVWCFSSSAVATFAAMVDEKLAEVASKWVLIEEFQLGRPPRLSDLEDVLRDIRDFSLRSQEERKALLLLETL
jgi:hypothetical protein